MAEVWKDIIWYEWLYQVSNLWNIKSIDRYTSTKVGYKIFSHGKLLKSSKTNCWYLIITLFKNRKRSPFMIHRLVWLSFIPRIEDKPFINHKDWNKQNNNVSNLERCNRSENTLHAYKLWKIKPSKFWLWKTWSLFRKSKPVAQKDLSWFIIKIWSCSQDIKRCLWYNSWKIRSCCRKEKYCHTYMWYIREYI